MMIAGSANTAVLTVVNEVIVIGDNTYGQLGCNEPELELPEVGKS